MPRERERQPAPPTRAARPETARVVQRSPEPGVDLVDGLEGHCACGGGCAACSRAALPVGPPDDHYEREANAIADRVVAGGDAGAGTALAAPAVRRTFDCGGAHEGGGEGAERQEERFQRQASGPGPAVAPRSVHSVLASPSRGLDAATRTLMETAFGRSFGDVRVHTDAAAARSAAAVGAVAYTVGRHVVFGEGRYAPSTGTGRAVLAHELAHVVQQSSGAPMGMLQRQTTPAPPVRGQTIEDFARGVAELARGPNFAAVQARLKVARGPVLSIVEDDLGRFYIGFNDGVPNELARVMQEAINAHNARVASGAVNVVRTSEIAVRGGHAEVNALNAAVARRQAELVRALVEGDVRAFRLHNVWLSGEERAFSAAARCEHCIGITRNVSVSDSVLFAETGSAGVIDRGPRLAGAAPAEPAARTASGEIDTSRTGPGEAARRAPRPAKARSQRAKKSKVPPQNSRSPAQQCPGRRGRRSRRRLWRVLLRQPLTKLRPKRSPAGRHLGRWPRSEARKP